MITPALPVTSRSSCGFSLVEAVITIAVIGIMASLVVGSISNMSRDAQRIVARQQQATLQNSINSWVMSQTRVSAISSQLKSINDIRALYNSQTTAKGKFETFLAPDITGQGGFLDLTTAQHFLEYTTNPDKLKTAALEMAAQHLTLPTWTAGGFPMVSLVDGN